MTPSSSRRPTRSAAIPRIGVIGATGAVGTVTLQLLAERGFDDVRAFASSRSAGKRVAYGDAELEVEEATPETLGGGDLDLCFFSVGTEASHELVPPAAAAGAVCIDKSDAFRLAEGVPLVVAGVNDGVLNGDEFSEESKLRAETRKILGLPDVPIQATCVRVPVLVGHSQATWVETVEPLSPEEARELLAAAPHVRLAEFPTPREAAGEDEVLVARIRQDMTDRRGLALWSVCDNLRKGAALNAVQIAEALLERRLLPA